MKLNINIENVNYIKITYKDKDDFTHCIKASLKRLDEREIVAGAKFDEKLFLITPQEVKLSIACDNGLYKANTILKHIENDEPYCFFTIKTPDDVEYQQKREYFRIKINENALISYKTDNEVKKISCETFDLSGNGVRLIIDEKYSLPENVNLTLYLPNKTVETEAKYIRTDEEDKILKASFSFINLHDVDLDCISQICLKKQLESRRKLLM